MPHPRLTALLLTLATALPVRADWKDDVGYTRLLQTFTSGVPTALSSGVTQVEAPVDANGSFMPNAANAEMTGKTLNRFGTATTSSWHATDVGRFFYGNASSLIPATGTVDVYHVNSWPLGSGDSRGVQNHSWISIYDPLNPPPGGIDAEVEGINAQLDYYINTLGFVCVVGVNNGSTSSTALPDLLCQGYNNISVGLSNGNHSAGFTTRDGAGRIKPDIVAPDPYYTSFSTPKVASAAGLLVQKITDTAFSPALSTADTPRVVKALLLAGATKEEFPSWARTSARPLDLRYGAGELNTLLAYNILLSGRVSGSNSAIRPHTAWAAESVSGTKTYFLDIPSGSAASRLSAALIWHRSVNQFLNASLANLDLKLYSVIPDTFTLGTVVDSSLSTVDNVEHLYQATLAPGRYALQVTLTSGNPTAYALAWRTSPTVSISATAAEARELDGTAGQFTITRTCPATTPLYVPFTIGGTAVSGTHYTSPPAGVLIPAGSSSATVSITAVADLLAQGDRTVTLSVATDFSLSAGTPASATVTIKDKPYDAWRFSKFTTPQLSSSTTSGPDADPDADGIPNLLEYAFALEPLAADGPSTLPSASPGIDDHLTFTYFQASNRTDLAFTPEWTDNLAGTWQSSTTYLTETARTPAPGGEVVTIRATTALATSPLQFFRLRVTRP
jgi:hypothetical protein